jgi:hypothetical protein
MLFNELMMIMLVWIVSFVATMLLYYVMTVNFPQYGPFNSIFVAVFGFGLAYLLSSYLLGAGVVMVPLIF